MELILWGLVILAALSVAVYYVLRKRRHGQGTVEVLQPLLGVAEPRVLPYWLVPLSPIEDEELAWQLDAERRKDMENNA